MATRTTTESAPRLSRGPLKALAVAALAILAAVAVVNFGSDDETSVGVMPETPVAVPIAVNEGVPPRGGLAETIQEQQAPATAPATVSEGVPPRGGLAEAIQEQRDVPVPASCGPAELAGVC